jgi:CubicO group peptidase (beta-lactamase class C family)
LLGLPGFVAGVVQDGKLSLVQAEGFADLESRTPMRQDHIFYVASLTKTFTAVMMMQMVQEKKISLDDYLLDYPFLPVGFTADRLHDPNVRLKHVLSHTSEGTPGDNYLYNGGRYNFVYGAFETVSGNVPRHQACAHELQNRIVQSLGLESTLPGHPTDADDPRNRRVATPYFLDAGHKTPTPDRGAAGSTTLYPSTGLLSSVDDLAKYMISLDEHALISAESYAQLTTPFKLNDGRLSTYGLGWSTQQIGGHSTHWHYGYGDSYAALLVRIPQKKTSFIFLSNTGAASAPFLLGYGNLLTSPIAVALLNHALPGVLTGADRDYSQAFLLRYAETAFGRHQGEAKTLVRQLAESAPTRFRQSDWALIWLLADIGDPGSSNQMNDLVAAHDESSAFHPDIILAIANYYQKLGDLKQCDQFLRQIADSIGWGEQGSTRDACIRLGTQYLRAGGAAEVAISPLERNRGGKTDPSHAGSPRPPPPAFPPHKTRLSCFTNAISLQSSVAILRIVPPGRSASGQFANRIAMRA